MDNIMVDIETLSNTPSAVVISVGAVYFNDKGLGDEFYYEVSPKGIEAQQRLGRDINIDTIAWWIDQNEKAKGIFKSNDEKKSTKDLLTLFTGFIGSNSNIKLWGNGSDFDNVIIASLYKSFNISLPWKFFNNRCYRTLKNMYPSVKMDRQGTAHNALDDAKSQALHLIKILEKL